MGALFKILNPKKKVQYTSRVLGLHPLFALSSMKFIITHEIERDRIHKKLIQFIPCFRLNPRFLIF